MKRYGIYIAVILMLLPGLMQKGFSQDNSDITLFKKVYPLYDTLNDPKFDSVIVKIDLNDYGYWNNIPPDNIGFFSFNNNYSWNEKDVKNTTIFQPEYASTSPGYLFDREVNRVCFWLYDQTGGHQFDSTRCFDIIYNKPQVALLDVSPSEKVTGSDIYVINQSNPDLEIQASSLFASSNVNSYITRIDMRKEGSTFWENLWTLASGVPEKALTVALPATFSMEPGTSTTFYLRSVGRTDNGYSGPLESSDEFPFTLTYLYTDFPDTICQVNSGIRLLAMPRGGSFSGNGIVDNTEIFNPSLANANAYNQVTYKYILSGQEFSLSENIYVIPLPQVSLEGALQVCANTTDAVYTILGAEPSKYDYIWEFTGIDEIIDSTDQSVTVHWQAQPASYTGKIRITLEGKNETQCPAVFEYLVDIDPDPAPDKPCVCFGDINQRLLLSSNTKAVYYEWFTTEGEQVGSTETPYYYLNDEVVKDFFIDENTRYYVRVADQLTGCYTTGFMCEETECSGAQLTILPSELHPASLSVTLLSNPLSGNPVVETRGSYVGPVAFSISNMSGAVVATASATKTSPADLHHLRLSRPLDTGFYLLTASYGQKQASPIKLIVY